MATPIADNKMMYSHGEFNNDKVLAEDGNSDPKAYLHGSFSSPSAGTPSVKRQPPPYVRSLSPAERADVEKKLVRRIDLRLIPMIIIMYIMNYLDRNNIAAARLGGLEEDLDLVGNQYQTSVSILFVGYVLMQIPSNLYLNRVGKPSIYLPTAMVIWGVISGLTAAVQNFAGIASVRFFLGFIEAAYFPGCLYYLSCWYTRKELGFRTALLYSGSLISGAFSGLIAAGITGNLDGDLGLRAWRWLFIIEGAITVVIAVAAYFLLPDFPRTTRWLSDDEKELAVWRLDEDIGEDDWIDSQHQSFWGGMKLAALDIKMWILVRTNNLQPSSQLIHVI
jgi:MFS family permease